MIQRCECCGKHFYARTAYKVKYCSKKCRINDRIEKDLHRGQPCWRCMNATGKCSWSRSLTPVEGWEAKKTIIKDFMCGDIESYNIISCPQFKEEIRAKAGV